MLPPLGKLEVHYRSPRTCIATLNGIMLVRSFRRSTAPDYRAMFKASEIALERRKQGLGVIVVIEPTAEIPNEETRRAAAEAARSISEHLQAAAIVVLGDGFWASAMRGLITALGLMTAQRYPQRSFRYESEAVDWILQVLNEPAHAYRQPLLDSLASMQAATQPPGDPRLLR
jgi:hypothetical protein